MYLPLLFCCLARLPEAGRAGDALDRGDPDADARVRPPDFGARLPVATGVAGGVGVLGGVRDILRRFGAGVASPSGGVSDSDSSVTDSCEDIGERAAFFESSLRGVSTREVA